MRNGTPVERATVVLLVGEDDERPAGLSPVEEAADLVVVRTRDDLADAVARADVLAVWDFRTRLLADVWPKAGRVSWIHAASAGVDAVLLPDLVDSDVVVTNARGVFDRSIAEYVVGLMLAFAKDLPGTLQLQRRRQWRHRETEPLADRRVLVVGAGSIGRAVARAARALGMVVTGVARQARRDDPDFAAVHAAGDLLRVLPDADYVVIAAPLTAATRGMFGHAALAAMRSDARLINVGRGPIVDERALVGALGAGEIAGAALDVFDTEPLPASSELWDVPGLLVSPHMSGDVVGWRTALSEQFVANFRRWQRGEPLHNVVDKRRGCADSESPGL